MARNSNIIFAICAVVLVCAAMVSAKPVKAKGLTKVGQVKVNKAATTTTVAPKAAAMIASLANLSEQMSCEDWMDTKMASSGLTMEDLASAIVEPEHRELALEFLLFCMMDETPMASRQSVLQDEIRKAAAPSQKL